MTWPDIIALANNLLRIPKHPGFLDGIEYLYADMLRLMDANPDGALLALLCPSAATLQHYSATQAVTSTVIATLAARSMVGWAAQEHRISGLAALTANVGMTALQDELVGQRLAPSVAQRTVMEGHARGSVKLLEEAGVVDAMWLEAVSHHHAATCGSLSARSKGLQIARLLQRIDVFVNQLRPQLAGRAAVSAAQAVQIAYLGEDGLPDEAGMHLVRALGVFPPGSVLRLAGGETAVVVRRGMLANLPVMAVIADAQGEPCTPALLNTAQTGAASALAPQQINITIQLEALLALAAPRPSSPFGRD